MKRATGFLSVLLAVATATARPDLLFLGSLVEEGTEHIETVIDVAVEEINRNATILPHTELRVQSRVAHAGQSNSQRAEAARVTLDLLLDGIPEDRAQAFNATERNPPVAVLGAYSTRITEDLTYLAEAFDVPVVGYTAVEGDLPAKSNYMCLWPQGDAEAQVVFDAVSFFGWHRVGLLYESHRLTQPLVEGLLSAFSGEVHPVDTYAVSYHFPDAADLLSENDPEGLSDAAKAAVDEATTKMAESDFRIVFVHAHHAQRYLWQSLIRNHVFDGQRVVYFSLSAGTLSDGSSPFNHTMDPEVPKGAISSRVSAPSPDSAEAIRVQQLLGNELLAKHQLQEVPRDAHSAYSAVWHLAKSMHHLIENGDVTNTTTVHSALVLEAMTSLRVSDSWSPNAKFNDNGIRPAYLDTLNWNVATGSWGVDGWWEQATDEFRSNEDNPRIFPNGPLAWGDTYRDYYIESDFVVQHDILSISPSATIPMFAANGAAILFAFAILAFNIVKRDKKLIKMSSANFNNLMIVGCVIVLSTIFISGLDSEQLGGTDIFETMCHVKVWLICVGFTFGFGSLFLKTFRVWRIFQSRDIGVVNISDGRLFLVLCLMLLVDAVVLTVWTWVDPLTYYREVDSLQPGPDGHFISKSANAVEGCRSENTFQWFFIVIVYKAMLALFGAFLAFRTRHVNIPVLNDSQLIGLSIYNVLLVSAMLVPMSYAVAGGNVSQTTIDSSFVLESVGLLVVVLLTLCLVFVPKIRAVIKGSEVGTSSLAYRSKHSKNSKISRRARTRWEAGDTTSTDPQHYTKGSTMSGSTGTDPHSSVAMAELTPGQEHRSQHASQSISTETDFELSSTMSADEKPRKSTSGEEDV